MRMLGASPVGLTTTGGRSAPGALRPEPGFIRVSILLVHRRRTDAKRINILPAIAGILTIVTGDLVDGAIILTLIALNVGLTRASPVIRTWSLVRKNETWPGVDPQTARRSATRARHRRGGAAPGGWGESGPRRSGGSPLVEPLQRLGGPGRQSAPNPRAVEARDGGPVPVSWRVGSTVERGRRSGSLGLRPHRSGEDQRFR